MTIPKGLTTPGTQQETGAIAIAAIANVKRRMVILLMAKRNSGPEVASYGTCESQIESNACKGDRVSTVDRSGLEKGGKHSDTHIFH